MRLALVLLTAAMAARAELHLALALPETLPFGEPCVLRLTLTNRGPGEETIASLDDVRWHWRISHVARPNHDTRLRTTGGLPAFGRIPPPRLVRLGSGDSLDFELQSGSVWEGFLIEGEYQIEVGYVSSEGPPPPLPSPVRATARIRVLFNPARDVPRLIEWLGHPDWGWRLTSHGYLRWLTQDQVLKDYAPRPRAKPLGAMRQATAWWSFNKDRVVLRDGRFEPK